MDHIERALNTAYSGGIQALVDAERTESGHIRGRFIGTEGNVYSYQIDPEGIEFKESHEDSEWINDYFLAKLDSEGVEYHGDSAYEYWMGRNSAPVRMDGPNCKTGTPCGNRCIARGKKCRVGASGASGAALKQGGSNLKKGLKAAAGLTAGLALGSAAAIAAERMRKKEANRDPMKRAEAPQSVLAGQGPLSALPPAAEKKARKPRGRSLGAKKPGTSKSKQKR